MNKEIINKAFDNRLLLQEQDIKQEVLKVIADLDSGKLRIAERNGDRWQVNEEAKKAVLLYFAVCEMKTMEYEHFEFYDKIPLKRNFASLGVRAVPPAMARYGSYLGRGVVLMPSYVNIGAFVDEGTMVDTWATVGSCAQIGKGVHLSGGVGIGGVLEPLMASPVIVEDHCFIGSRCIVVEGVRICEGAVLGANTTITQSTKIIDVTAEEPVEYKAIIPANSVVVPGSYAKTFPSGVFNVNCALIIGQRKDSTDRKTSLNQALRDFNVAI